MEILQITHIHIHVFRLSLTVNPILSSRIQ